MKRILLSQGTNPTIVLLCSLFYSLEFPMSHTVQVKSTVLTNRDVLDRARTRLGLPSLTEGKHKLFGGSSIEGLALSLPGWNYPVVIDAAGKAHYDNYNGAWGQEIELDKLIQAYTVEQAAEQCRNSGYSVEETVEADGLIQLTATQY